MSEPILINTGPSPRGWHRVESVLKCAQLYAHQQIIRAPRPPRDPLVRGTLLHVGLAHHYARLRQKQLGLDQDAYMTPREAIDAVSMLPEHTPLGEVYAPVVTAAVTAYQQTFANEHLEVVAVEEMVDVNMNGKGFDGAPREERFTQRWDLVIRDQAGYVFIFDHKSTGKYETKSVKRYMLSGQFLAMQRIGASMFGDKFGGVRVNLIAFQEPFKFVRAGLDSAPSMLARLPQNIVYAEELVRLYAPLDPWHYPRAMSETICMGPYGPCDFWDACRFGERHPNGVEDPETALF